MDDPLFNQHIYQRAEFQNTKIPKEIDSVEQKSNEICEQPFLLSPHQIFIRNYLSPYSPYTSALLYHGLGSGKTCSALGIAEEIRKLNMRMGLDHKHTYIIAMPNIQNNFRHQLFHESDLVRISSSDKTQRWKLNTCVGAGILENINQVGTRKQVIMRIKQFIRKHYKFIGYAAMVHMILGEMQKTKSRHPGITDDRLYHKVFNRLFSGHFLIIDEIQNIKNIKNLEAVEEEEGEEGEEEEERKTTAGEDDEKFSVMFSQMVKYVNNMRFVFLSATPMYNSPAEIIWITNMMNINDGRPPISIEQVFQPDGEFVVGDPARNIPSGQDLLRRKLTGYVSYIRSESPYSFPFRIYPSEFAPEKSITNKNIPYPKYQLNGLNLHEHADSDIIQQTSIQHLPVYISNMSEYQSFIYLIVIRNLIGKHKLGKFTTSIEMMKVMSANKSLNVIYPTAESFQQFRERGLDQLQYFSNKLENVMKRDDLIHNYRYKDTSPNGPTNRMFSPAKIGTYSTKLKTIGDCVEKSEGIIIIFSQYIDSGVIPIALMLEEMGFSRKVNNSVSNLFQTPPASTNRKYYTLITGSSILSPNNAVDVQALNRAENIDGSLIKVAIISMAGAEGIDFKNVRQVHILDAWYNLSRVEQIIGRGVRFRSHCRLPFEKRNVQIYLHGSKVHPKYGDYEPVDLYMYRKAEIKSIQIGKVTRLLKETAVDCLLTENQSLLTQEELAKVDQNKEIECVLSDGSRIPYMPGDKPFTNMCDWMESCYYKCKVDDRPTTSRDVDRTSSIQYSTYSDHHISSYVSSIRERIFDLFQTELIYDKENLIRHIQYTREYPLDAVYTALNEYIQFPEKYPIVTATGVTGRLRRSSTQYYFQPNMITDPYSSLQENMLFAPKPTMVPITVDETAEVVDVPVAEVGIDAQKQMLMEQIEMINNLGTDADATAAAPASTVSIWLRSYLEIVKGLPSIPATTLFVHHWLDALEIKKRLLWLKDSIRRQHSQPPPPTVDVEEENAVAKEKEVNALVDSYFAQFKVVYKRTALYMLRKPDEDKQNKFGISYYFYRANKQEVAEVQANEMPMITAQLREQIPNFKPLLGFYFIVTDTTTQFKLVDRTIVPEKGKLKGVVCGTGKTTPSMWLEKIFELIPGHALVRPISALSKNMNNTHMCVLVEVLLRELSIEGQLFFVSPEHEYIYNSIIFPTKGPL